MKILHVIPDLAQSSGGPVSAIYGLTKAQTALGHQVDVVSTDYGKPDFLAMAATVTICHCIYNRWRYSSGMKRILQAKIAKADIIHIHTIWDYPSLLATRICKKLKKNYIIRPCGMLDKWSLDQSLIKKWIYIRLFSKTLFQTNSIMHFTTEAEKEKSIYPGKMQEVIVANGIADEAFAAQEVDPGFFKKYPELKDKKIVLFLGRVDQKKQPDLAIKAFSEIIHLDKNLYMVIAGPCKETYKNNLKKLVSRLGLQDSALFTGLVKDRSLYDMYRAASVYVLPSLQENFGISVVEAMAGYCPVVISDQVDIKDLIRHEKAGIVCTNNISELAEAIKKIITNPLLAKEMGENGRRVSEESFTWEHAAGQLEQTYNALVKDQTLDSRFHGNDGQDRNDDFRSDDSTTL